MATEARGGPRIIDLSEGNGDDRDSNERDGEPSWEKASAEFFTHWQRFYQASAQLKDKNDKYGERLRASEAAEQIAASRADMMEDQVRDGRNIVESLQSKLKAADRDKWTAIAKAQMMEEQLERVQVEKDALQKVLDNINQACASMQKDVA